MFRVDCEFEDGAFGSLHNRECMFHGEQRGGHSNYKFSTRALAIAALNLWLVQYYLNNCFAKITINIVEE